jgi:hypothetical protein
VIQTGKRNVVMVAQGGGKFMPVDIDIGLETNGQTEVVKAWTPVRKLSYRGNSWSIRSQPQRRDGTHEYCLGQQ